MTSPPTYFRSMSHFGRFRVMGSEAGVLLHHLTTNNIKKLKNGEGCDAILITNKARVLDWLQIWRDESGYEVLTSPNRRALFPTHAQKFILFRQDVKIEDESDGGARFGLFGDIRQVLASWNAKAVLDAPLNYPTNFQIGETRLKISRTRRLPQNGVLIESDDRESLQKMIQECGAQNCDDETFNVLRVEAGIPATGLELTEDVNPWEANLGFAVSLDKGCYNGQEVVARLNTYQKIKQNLFGLKLQNKIAMSALTTSKVLLKSDGRDAGFLTSATLSPRSGPIALGYVRREFQEPGRALQVLDAVAQTATVCALPFETGQPAIEN